MAVPLPRYYFIDKGLLFACSPAEIDASGFNALVTHQVGEQSNVVVLFKEILGVAMTERVRVNNFLVQAVFVSIVLELLRNATGRDALTVPC